MISKRTTGFSLLFTIASIGFVTGLAFNFSELRSENSETQSIDISQNPAVRQLQTFSEGLAVISEAVTPTVVTIFSTKTEKVQQFQFNDPLFDRFFNPQQMPPRERKSRGLGSGVVVKSDGTILTNNHVVEGADDLQVKLSDGRTFTAELIGRDPKSDIAVIKIDAKNLPNISLGDSDKMRVGEWVLAIGNPFSENLNHTVTQGIISGIGRSEVGITAYDNFIQTDAAINPGNSGGALVNLKGELIGINTAILSRDGGFAGVGFAIPINQAKEVMDDLISQGKVVRGWLGVTIQNVTTELKEAMGLEVDKGILVSSVLANGPAEKSGLESGDVIIELDGKEVEEINSLRNKIAGKDPGDVVKLKVIRDGKEKTVKVTLGELPEDIADWQRSRGKLSESPEDLFGMQVKTFDENFAKKFGIDKNEKGVIVTSAEPNSSIFSAGIREGDLIQKIGKQKIESLKDFKKATENIPKDSPVAFYIKRESGSLFIAVNFE